MLYRAPCIQVVCQINAQNLIPCVLTHTTPHIQERTSRRTRRDLPGIQCPQQIAGLRSGALPLGEFEVRTQILHQSLHLGPRCHEQVPQGGHRGCHGPWDTCHHSSCNGPKSRIWIHRDRSKPQTGSGGATKRDGDLSLTIRCHSWPIVLDHNLP